MASSDVLKIYNSLNAEQKQFVASKKLEATFKIKKWLELLENVAIMDSFADVAIKKFTTFKWTCAIIAILIVIVTFILMSVTAYGAFLFVGAIISLVFYYAFNARQKHFREFDLSNGLRLFTIPLMKVLREETDKENLISMNLDFNNTVSKEYLIKQTEHSGKSYPKVDTYIYRNRWMSATTKLSDEVEVDWNITDLIVKKHITKRSSSGKYKTKNKVKVKHSLHLTVSFPKVNFTLIDTPKNFIYLDKNDCHTFKLKGTTLSANNEASMDMNYFLDAIATSFTYIQPIKA